MNGLVMVTSERVWLVGKKLLVKHGFESVDEVPPFNLMVLKFNDTSSPTFSGNLMQKTARFGESLTVIRSDQCPYIPDATSTVLEFAAERSIPSQVVELTSYRDVRDLAPSPYGVFSIVYNGQLLAYHYLLPKNLAKIFGEVKK